MEAGFTVQQLAKAEQALASGNSPSLVDTILPKIIVSTMTKKKMVGTPWEGSLPLPRVSPPCTLGDCLASATYRNTTRDGASRSPARHDPSGPGKRSNSFEIPSNPANSKNSNFES